MSRAERVWTCALLTLAQAGCGSGAKCESNDYWQLELLSVERSGDDTGSGAADEIPWGEVDNMQYQEFVSAPDAITFSLPEFGHVFADRVEAP